MRIIQLADTVLTSLFTDTATLRISTGIYSLEDGNLTLADVREFNYRHGGAYGTASISVGEQEESIDDLPKSIGGQQINHSAFAYSEGWCNRGINPWLFG